MKKIAFAFTALLLLFVVGCNGGKPKDVSEQHYKYGKKAVEIIDQYLDYEISGEEAYEKMKSLTAREDSLPKSEYGDPTHLNDSGIEIYVSGACWNLVWMKDMASETRMADLINERNKIAERIGMSAR